MFILTKDDEGKEFVLDNTNQIVTLVKSLDGFRGVIVFPSGQALTILSRRLTPVIDKNDNLQKELFKTKYKNEKEEKPSESPLKVIRLELIIEHQDGSKEIKLLEGEDANKWYQYEREMALFAQEKGKVYPFAQLNWNIKKIK